MQWIEERNKLLLWLVVPLLCCNLSHHVLLKAVEHVTSCHMFLTYVQHLTSCHMFPISTQHVMSCHVTCHVTFCHMLLIVSSKSCHVRSHIPHYCHVMSIYSVCTIWGNPNILSHTDLTPTWYSLSTRHSNLLGTFGRTRQWTDHV